MFLEWKLFDWSIMVQFYVQGLKAQWQISMDLEWKMFDWSGMVQFYWLGYRAQKPSSSNLEYSCLVFSHVIGQMLKLLYDWLVHSSITKSLLLLYKDIKFFMFNFKLCFCFTIYNTLTILCFYMVWVFFSFCSKWVNAFSILIRTLLEL